MSRFFFLLWGFIACTAENATDRPFTSEFTCIVEDFSFVVAIVTINDLVKCAGTLIDANFVLTAAHCVEESNNYFVFAGISNPLADALKIQVKNVVIHPDYLKAERHNDIAVVHLMEPIEESTYIKYVVLPKRPFESEYLKEICDNALIILWKEGYQKDASHLKGIECIFIEILPNSNCKKMYQNTQKFNTNSCDQPLPGQDTCIGDTGGPLLCTTMQTGVISWGLDCGIPSDSAMFTRIDQYLEAIKEMKNSSMCLNISNFILTITSSIMSFFKF